MSALPIPDPIAFALGALEARGALTDQDDQGPYLLLPEGEAQALQVPPELRLHERPDVPGTIFCGLGSALLDQLCQGLRAAPLRTSLRLDAPTPRPGQATSLAQRVVFRNAIHEVLDAGPLQATYVSLVASYVVEADDRHEGLLVRTMGADGAEPDAGLRLALDPTEWSPDTLFAPAPDEDISSILGGLASGLEAQLRREHLPPLIGAFDRRKRRDHERITAYFAELIAEARAPRRKTDREAIARKVEHLLAERDTKLRDLDARYAARVRIQVAAVITVAVPSLVVGLRVRRRKESRELRVRLPARSSALDAFRCEGCSEPTTHPAVCDLRLHLLCEQCVPSAQGRFDCPACRAAKALFGPGGRGGRTRRTDAGTPPPVAELRWGPPGMNAEAGGKTGSAASAARGLRTHDGAMPGCRDPAIP